jgi:hypothetical protein
MGFIRIQTKTKKGKEYRYYYYCERRRSHVKEGGTGKVRSIDKLIGNSLTGKYLEFWLWDGLSVTDYLESLIAYEIKRFGFADRIEWSITWKRDKKGKAIAGKLTIRAKYEQGFLCLRPLIDARSHRVRWLKNWVMDYVETILEFSQSKIAEEIESLAVYLARYQRDKEWLKQAEAKYQDWLANPEKVWEKGGKQMVWADNAGEILELQIEVFGTDLDRSFANYQEGIPRLVRLAPPSERERFKATIIRQIEKLAASPNFLDRYEAR